MWKLKRGTYMKIKTLQFYSVQGVINDYEQADAGCLYVRIWPRKNKNNSIKAFQITIDTDADQVDGAFVTVEPNMSDLTEDEVVERANKTAKMKAQEMFENYIRNNFLD